ncbi:hypothetical protein [Nodosilinea sp. P-1105]|uniref:hypothetical protein n=1 Tax=Nodosilinea sp. P-1105 TaxID=2546229 RepID=UPI00146BD412|nr:hypothetical protein [Nodosilinea sp. P-1105]
MSSSYVSKIWIKVLAEETVRSLTSLIGSAPGSFATPEEADQFIRQERLPQRTG